MNGDNKLHPVTRFNDRTGAVETDPCIKEMIPEGRSADDQLRFFCGDKEPKLPLKDYGKLWHMGWDIPTEYAIDADGNVWKDFGHGGPLSPVTQGQLLSDIEKDAEWVRIARILGKPVRQCGICGHVWRDGYTVVPNDCCQGRKALQKILKVAQEHIDKRHPYDALNALETGIKDLLKQEG